MSLVLCARFSKTFSVTLGGIAEQIPEVCFHLFEADTGAVGTRLMSAAIFNTMKPGDHCQTATLPHVQLKAAII